MWKSNLLILFHELKFLVQIVWYIYRCSSLIRASNFFQCNREWANRNKKKVGEWKKGSWDELFGILNHSKSWKIKLSATNHIIQSLIYPFILFAESSGRVNKRIHFGDWVYLSGRLFPSSSRVWVCVFGGSFSFGIQSTRVKTIQDPSTVLTWYEAYIIALLYGSIYKYISLWMGIWRSGPDDEWGGGDDYTSLSEYTFHPGNSGLENESTFVRF